MTEKDYSGITTKSKIGKNAKVNLAGASKASIMPNKTSIQIQTSPKQNEVNINNKNISEDISKNSNSSAENYLKAGKIAKQVKDFSKQLIKPNMPLVEIAEKIEGKIIELGGEVAFPVNLSIDDVAAHYTPTLRDEKLAQGLLKVDLGVHINGYICDIAFSIDLTSEKKYSKLIEASEKALESALVEIKSNKENSILDTIGRRIKEAISSYNFSPIINLSGHGLDEFDIHSGLTIPNYNNGNKKQVGEGSFAIEPFATPGSGIIYEGPGSNIYHIVSIGQGKQVRDNFSREILAFIIENKKTLPFSQRELEKKFGSKALFAILNLKRAGIIEEFPQLIEKSHFPVSQAETSLIIHDNKVEVLCR
jgi:methionyl aminopeptidase